MIALNIVYHLNQRAIIGVVECVKYQRYVTGKLSVSP